MTSHSVTRTDTIIGITLLAVLGMALFISLCLFVPIGSSSHCQVERNNITHSYSRICQ
jgi:hypothetical protein